jgi:hypothetical protein
VETLVAAIAVNDLVGFATIIMETDFAVSLKYAQ